MDIRMIAFAAVVAATFFAPGCVATGKLISEQAIKGVESAMKAKQFVIAQSDSGENKVVTDLFRGKITTWEFKTVNWVKVVVHVTHASFDGISGKPAACTRAGKHISEGLDVTMQMVIKDGVLGVNDHTNGDTTAGNPSSILGCDLPYA